MLGEATALERWTNSVVDSPTERATMGPTPPTIRQGGRWRKRGTMIGRTKRLSGKFHGRYWTSDKVSLAVVPAQAWPQGHYRRRHRRPTQTTTTRMEPDLGQVGNPGMTRGAFTHHDYGPRETRSRDNKRICSACKISASDGHAWHNNRNVHNGQPTRVSGWPSLGGSRRIPGTRIPAAKKWHPDGWRHNSQRDHSCANGNSTVAQR